MTILDAMGDPALFEPWFRPASTWKAWLVFLAALFGLELEGEALNVYRRHSGRELAPESAAREGWLIVGRRGGKSRVAALVAVYLGCFRDYSQLLAPGERGTLMIIAADRRQARTVFRYVEGLLDGVPMLAELVESRTRETINLTNRVSIEVHTASFRAVRGYTVVAAICDEIAFWRSEESVNPDAEILNGLRPGMATVPGAMLLCMSSPYARRGVLWEAHQRHFGKDGDPVLVWQADTRSMNPSVPEEIIAAAKEADEAAASAEYGAQFRQDIEGFVSREALNAVVVPGRIELPPLPNTEYGAFVDPSGGSNDSMTLAIGHTEKRDGNEEIRVLDLVREVRPPFSPEGVVQEFAGMLKLYRISSVTGDRYGGEWPRERFSAYGIAYQVSERTKADIYREFLPLINSRRAELLDNRRLLTQLVSLERRTGRGGRDSIDHTPNAHDDLANAAAGVLTINAPSVRILGGGITFGNGVSFENGQFWPPGDRVPLSSWRS